MLADLCLVSDDFTVVADKASVEVEDDVDEEEDVHDGVEDKHCDVCRVAWRPKQWTFGWNKNSSTSLHLLQLS